MTSRSVGDEEWYEWGVRDRVGGEWGSLCSYTWLQRPIPKILVHCMCTPW